MHYPVWTYCSKQPNYDFCISQGSVATVLKWGGQNRSHLRQVFFVMFRAKNYLNQLTFHGVIQKITLAQFFLRHGVYVFHVDVHAFVRLLLLLLMSLFRVYVQGGVQKSGTFFRQMWYFMLQISFVMLCITQREIRFAREISQQSDLWFIFLAVGHFATTPYSWHRVFNFVRPPCGSIQTWHYMATRSKG